MKHVRTFLSLLVVGLMLTGTAWAQGDLSLGGGGDAGGLATGITDATFSGSASMTVRLLHPYHHADSVVEGSYVDTVKTVSARTDGAKVLKFTIENLTASQDTLRTVTVRSFNDKPNSFENIYLYRDADSTGAGTKIGEVLDLGSSTTFSENEALAFSINDTIPAGDTVYYWFTADMDSARIDTLFNDQFCGLKIFQNGLFLATNGYAPTGATDTLRYAATDAAFPEPHCDETGVGGPNGDGRVLIFDTKPPEMTIELTHALDTAGCGANSIINLGDSIFITVWDTVEVFEITKAWANLCVFGGSATAAFGDTLDVGADSAVTWGLMMPDTDSSITCPLDVAPWFYWLVVTTEDEPGNQKIDSLLVSYAIDNQQPVFDGDSVWMELTYDANGDGTAAVDDIVQVFAYFTSNSFGEIDAVTVDMSNWGYGATEPMTDPSGNRKWFSASFDVLTGSEDWAADSSASLFTVTALDNACNWDTVSNVAHFAVDNEGPFAPLQFLYESLMDLDSNAIINVGDSVLFTIDATNTSDLAAVCEVVLDLYAPGLGGDPSQCVEDTDLAGQHVLRYGIVAGTANAATGVHTVDVTLTDDAGNSADFTSSVLQRPIDNEPPLPVADLDATRSPCAIDLSWTSSNADDARYFIFWDGGDGWTAADTTRDADGNLVFLDTLGSVIPPALSWTTDGTVVLTHGATYEFVVRTADDADNYEWNFARVATTADCEPPTVCINYPASGGAYGLTNPITVVAESPDADIAVATLYIRDSDAGGGVPSAWASLGGMTQVGGGQQFTLEVEDADIPFGNTGDQTYEFLTVGTDLVGNSQTLSEADAACDDFSFLWFHTALQTALMTVNDTILPQTSCGYNVTRDDNNTVIVNVTDHVDGRTYTFDIFHLVSGDADYRIHYEENVGVLPYSFALDATDWLKGTNTVFVVVTRDDGNVGQLSFDVCVPDDIAPDATILYPIDGQRVRRMNSVLNPLEVWAQVTNWTYDPAPVSRVDFAQATSYDMTANYSVFGVQTVPAAGIYKWLSWDTRAFSDGDTVYLQATFYDDKNNTQTTPVVTVYMDGQATDIILTCPQAASINGVPVIAGTVDFFAEIQESYNDFTNLMLYYKKSTDPDIFSYWTSAGAMAPGTDEGVYVTYGFNTTGLASDMNWDWRVIATDITGHVMFDLDGDGVFDDNTFDPATWNSDNYWRVDNTPADFAIKEVLSGGITFPTPSTKLNGAGMIYVPARQDITAWSQTIPMSDTFEVTRVNYIWRDASDVTSVAQVGPLPWYEATFNPYDLGLYTDMDVMNSGYSGWLVVSKEDSLNRAEVRDSVTVTVLDVDPNQALVAGVTWGQYVWGDVGLTALSLNAYNIRWVIYEFRPDDETVWTVIDSSSAGGSFGITWHTLGNAPDGWGWVRATAVDNDFNRDPNPTPMKIYVANALPTVTMTAPTPDSSFIGEDFEGNGTIFTAAIGEGYVIPIQSVQFMRKGVLQGNGSWSVWATDNWLPYQAEWDDDLATDGAYHFMVRAWNSAGRSVDSDWWTFYHDEMDPNISQTKIAGQDVEANNDPALNLTGLDEIMIEGAFFDNESSTGANSGVVKVGFELQDQSGSRVFAKFIDPATDGLHSVMFNISGLPTGQYGFYYRAWDAVGNMNMIGPVWGWIYDQTPPTTSVIGHYGNRLYGYDWNGDATRALFEYYNGTEWVGIGAAAPLSIDYSWNNGEIDNFWWTTLDPASIPAGTHPFHMMATDASGNWSATNALEINVTSENGVLTFAAGTDLSDLAVLKNYETCNFEGVLSVEAASANTPIVLGVYEDGEFGTDDYSYESVMLRPYLQGTLFQEDVHPYDIFCGGKAVFMVGAADGEGALNTDISSYRYRDDLGTNGMVLGNDDNVEVTIPAGDHDGCLMVLETLLPRSGPFQDRWEPIGNHNSGMANYIGDDECDCFDDNRFATIKMSYDPTVILPAESLMVAWWDEEDGEWSPIGIYYLTGDEGFDTEAHTVEFSTNCLHGVFAVLALREPSQPGTISFEFVEANPWCNGYVGPHHYYSQPKFVWRVVDWYSEIDPDMFEIKLDGYYIHKFGSDADFWSTSWDAITQELRIYPYHGDYESGADFASDLECGDHTLYIGAKNKQANFASMTWEFTVDCTPPTVVFNNDYVTKNPTISFTVTDDLAGVDWDHVFVDVVAYESNNIDLENPNQDENLFFLGTFFPGQVEYYADLLTGEVTITTTYDLEHKRGIMVAIYDGTRSEHASYYSIGDPVSYGDWDEFYLHGHGVMDCVGNSGDPWFQVLTIDNTGPMVVTGDGRCSDILIADDGSGVDATMFEIYEDGSEIHDSLYSYDANTGYMEYCPTGTEVTLVAYDNAGNRTVETWIAVGTDETVDNGEGFNWPNPFDPNEGSTTIESNFMTSGSIMITIYDFAGNEVRTLTADNEGVATWNGKSSDGEIVANGVYFAYCKASDGSHKVVKIAVIKD